MSWLVFRPVIVEWPRSKLEAIAAARTAFARCQFDEQACSLGLRRLRASLGHAGRRRRREPNPGRLLARHLSLRSTNGKVIVEVAA
jgi:hypothetical protein